MLRKKLKLMEFSKKKIQHNLSESEEADPGIDGFRNILPNDGGVINKLQTTTSSNAVESEFQSEQNSQYFSKPLWKQVYDIECALNLELEKLTFEPLITYNPIIYASEVHINYLMKYLKSPKKVVIVGMNPGPNGMAQTGVPFGSANIVRNHMKLDGKVEQPPILNPKRKITGLSCTKEEPSGNKFWSLIIKLSGSIETFSQQCFMHNFCPIVIYDRTGKNITPSELKGTNKKLIRDICLTYLINQLHLLKPKIVIGVGSYVGNFLKYLEKKQIIDDTTKYLKLIHPSPRSLNNHDWSEKAEKFFEENDLIKFLRNEV